MVMVRAPEAVHHHNDSRDVRINAATDRNPTARQLADQAIQLIDPPSEPTP
jgi:hypothetical protein